MATSRSPGGRSGASRFPPAPTEAELRRLAGQAVFAEADTWEKAQHVLDARIGVDAHAKTYLVGRVLGTWRRADEAIITADGRGIGARCSCGTAGPGRLCRHAVALLLHWARHSSSFQTEHLDLSGRYEEDDDFIDEDLDDDEIVEQPTGAITPRAHLERLLHMDQMNHLRQIARERGVKVTAKTKAELVERLAGALSTPDSLAAALAGLTSAEIEVLVLADLLAGANRATSETVARALQAMKQGAPQASIQRAGTPLKPPPALRRLTDLGLLFLTSDQAGTLHYAVPVGVTEALGPRPDLLAARSTSGASPRPARPGLGLIEVMRVILDAVSRGEIGKTLSPLIAGQSQGIPDGWVREPVNPPADVAKGGRSSWSRREVKQTFRLRPLAGAFSVADRLTLVERTGASVALTDFAVRCLFAIGALHLVQGDRSQRVHADDQPLQNLSMRTPLDQLGGLIAIWLRLPDTLEMTSLLGPSGATDTGILEYRYTTDAYNWWTPAPSGAGDLRRLIARLMGRLTDGGREAPWYDLDALLDFLWRLDPAIIAEGSHHGPYSYGFTEPGSSSFLGLTHHKHWQRVWQPVVTDMLTGPLTWLGLVDVATDQKGALGFRPRPAAGALVGHPDGAETEATPTETAALPARPIAFAVDSTEALHATVPSGYPDASVHALFSAWGELEGASPQGLRYRFHLDMIHQSFEEGMTGARLLERLTALAGGSLSPDVEALLRRWAEAYGAVRLYDDLTLIQVSDDFLLRELMATSSLAGAILQTFSPRLAAVDPEHVDDLVAELTRLGYSPRVLEGT